MDDAQHERVARNMRFTLEMMKGGFEMKRQQLRRRNPDADEAEISRLFAAWLQDRPMDGEGRVVPWPRPRRDQSDPT